MKQKSHHMTDLNKVIFHKSISDTDSMIVAISSATTPNAPILYRNHRNAEPPIHSTIIN